MARARRVTQNALYYGAFGLAYATAALLVVGALIVADHRNGVRNVLWVSDLPPCLIGE